MNHVDNAFLILGSPRAERKSTSQSLGSYILGRLEEKGTQTSFVHAHRIFRTPDGMVKLLCGFDGADLIILSSPLYVDSLPAPVIRVMETLAGERLVEESAEKGFAAILNCGFPEAGHTEVALAICRRFAQETGLKWQGGLGLGGGEAIRGKSLDKAGGLARNIRRSLQLAAVALAEGQTVPEKAIMLMSKPLVPFWLYRWLGQRGWKRRAKRYGVEKDLMARPFE